MVKHNKKVIESINDELKKANKTLAQIENKNNQSSLKNNSIEKKIKKLKSKNVKLKEEILKCESEIEKVNEFSKLNSDIIKTLEQLRNDVKNYHQDVTALKKEENDILTKELLQERAKDKKEIKKLSTQNKLLLENCQLEEITKTKEFKIYFENHRKKFEAYLETQFEDEGAVGKLGKLGHQNKPGNETRVSIAENKPEDHKNCLQENVGSGMSYEEIDETSKSELYISK